MTVDKKKQNILFVHNYYQIPGGEDTVVVNEMKMLEKHGHKVFLYSRNNADLKQMSKLQKLSLTVTTVFNPRTYRDIKKLIKEEDIEVVHVHNDIPRFYHCEIINVFSYSQSEMENNSWP